MIDGVDIWCDKCNKIVLPGEGRFTLTIEQSDIEYLLDSFDVCMACNGIQFKQFLKEQGGNSYGV